MQLAEIAIENYRSIRSIRFPLRRLTVLVGENGTGKTNLYRALELVHAAAIGNFSEKLASEGGLQSASWAGPRKSHEKPGIRLGVTLDNCDDNTSAANAHNGSQTTRYSLEVGFPQKVVTPAFELEAQIKSESVEILTGRRTVELMGRKKHVVYARNEQGVRHQIDNDLLGSETALSHLGVAAAYPELSPLHNALSQWRFFHGFRTDPQSSLRQAAHPVTSPLLNSDGSNLAAVFATLVHIREDTTELDSAIDDAFPGARLVVPRPMQDAQFAMMFPDLPKREFKANELSDGTLQYLALMGALLSYRLPRFIALNEPETSLHPSLLPALGRLIARAARRTQILVVTHSETLAEAIQSESGIEPRRVIKQDGATWLEGLSQIGIFTDD